MIANPLGQGGYFSMKARCLRIDRGHHAAAVVAASGDRVEQGFVQALDNRAQAVLQHPVELECLAGSDAQRLSAMRAGQLVQLQPLRRGADPARQAHPDHELVGRFQLLAAALVAQVPVVLLVDAVKLHQLHVIRRWDGPGDAVEQAFGDGPAQVVAGILHPLVGA